jgi:hypothetical protein
MVLLRRAFVRSKVDVSHLLCCSLTTQYQPPFSHNPLANQSSILFDMSRDPEERWTSVELERADNLRKSDPSKAEASYRAILDRKAGMDLELSLRIW